MATVTDVAMVMFSIALTTLVHLAEKTDVIGSANALIIVSLVFYISYPG
jgi:hypothetical protein